MDTYKEFCIRFWEATRELDLHSMDGSQLDRLIVDALLKTNGGKELIKTSKNELSVLIRAINHNNKKIQQSSLPSNLDEAAEEYADESCFDDPEFTATKLAFIAGAEWRANQLLKDSPLPEDTVLFQKGVEEGRRLEKDEHRLTWQDMAKIDAIILDMNNEFAVDYSKEIDRQKFYEEVLKRFREIKDEQVHQTTKE